MADALPPRLLVERPSEAGFVKRTEDAGPRQKLARGTIVDKPSLKLKGIVARYVRDEILFIW